MPIISGSSHVVAGVSSVAKAGDPAITGAVTLSAGAGITLTEVAHDIAVSVSGPLLQSASVTLDDAHIKALPTTAVKLVDPVGATFAPVPLALFVHLDPSAGGYTNCDATAVFVVTTVAPPAPGVVVFAENANSDFPLFANNATAPLFGAFDLGPYAEASGGGFVNDHGWANAPLYCYVTNGALGNFTGGNAANTMTVTVLYVVIPL